MEEVAATPGGAPVVLVAAGRHQVWHPTLYALPLSGLAGAVGGLGMLVLPRAAESWWVPILFIGAMWALVGLLGTLGLRVGPGRNHLVDTGPGLRLHRWWGTHEIGWGEVERVVFAENGTAEGTKLGGAADLLPRVVVHPCSGRRVRVVFAAFDADLGRQVERLESGCARARDRGLRRG